VGLETVTFNNSNKENSLHH